MAHVSAFKKKVVKDFVSLMKEHPIIAAVNMENLPAKQLQNMRSQLRGRVILRMSKRRLILKALEEAENDKKGISKLKEHLKGMPALLFTSENPFSLFKLLKKNKSKAPIKPGQKAPHDIVVPAGPTGFAPGPIISELSGFGIKTGIENGKVAIKEDSLVAKKGDTVSAGLAGVLTRLGIEPMEVGLDLTACYENGEIITKDVLDVDEDAYKAMIVEAYNNAFNLSFNSGFPTDKTITTMISSANNNAVALALEVGFLTSDTLSIALSKAASQASVINSIIAEEKPGASDIDTQPKDNEPKEKKEDNKSKKEEISSGLGALFG